VSTFRDLQETGDLDPSLNLEEFTKKVYPTLENVPETIIYDKESNTFKEKEKGCCGD
jgi:NitT/TauT family transport system substrate-binding protein